MEASRGDVEKLTNYSEVLIQSPIFCEQKLSLVNDGEVCQYAKRGRKRSDSRRLLRVIVGTVAFKALHLCWYWFDIRSVARPSEIASAVYNCYLVPSQWPLRQHLRFG